MSNKWSNHVKEFAKKHGLTYGCAMSDPRIKDGYEITIKLSTKQRKQKKDDVMNKTVMNSILQRIKKMTNEERPLVLMKYNAANQSIRDTIKEEYPKYYNKLKNK